MLSPQTFPYRPIASAVRSILHVGVACCLAVIAVDTWLVSGVFMPIIVAGGSMAPGLRGAHREWICAGCRHEFSCGLESLPDARRSAVCPDCGAANDPDAGIDRPGDRVLIDRLALAWRSPRRFEVVALDCPEMPGGMCVKRVVGLPGERIEIRDGEILVDGHLARKSLAAQRAVAVLIHNAARATEDSPENAARWRDTGGHWRHDGATFVHPANATSQDHGKDDLLAPIDWLEYHHPARGSSSGHPTDGPVLDESAYDQSESRLLHPVRDVLVRGAITGYGPGQLHLRARIDGEEFQITIDLVSGDCTLAHDEQIVKRMNVAIPPDRPVQLEWMLADRQVKLALEDRVLISYCYEPIASQGPTSGGDALTDVTDIAIGSQDAAVTLEQLQVFRDIYYVADRPVSGQAEWRLGPDEYFLLGDNLHHSQDSRWWQAGAVTGRALLGRVVRW